MTPPQPSADIFEVARANDHNRDDRGRPAHDKEWRITNSSLSDYCGNVAFRGIPDVVGLLKARAEREDVALDLAGGLDARAVQDLIAAGVATRGIVTTLSDRRQRETKRNPDIFHVKGDLLRPETWKNLRERSRYIAPQGLGTMVHRPYGALQQLPWAWYVMALGQSVDMLRPGGTIFTQIPSLPSDVQRSNLFRAVCAMPDVQEIRVGRRTTQPQGMRALGPQNYALITKRGGDLLPK